MSSYITWGASVSGYITETRHFIKTGDCQYEVVSFGECEVTLKNCEYGGTHVFVCVDGVWVMPSARFQWPESEKDQLLAFLQKHGVPKGPDVT